jgi:hypothetical protein
MRAPYKPAGPVLLTHINTSGWAKMVELAGYLFRATPLKIKNLLIISYLKNRQADIQPAEHQAEA